MKGVKLQKKVDMLYGDSELEKKMERGMEFLCELRLFKENGNSWLEKKEIKDGFELMDYSSDYVEKKFKVLLSTDYLEEKNGKIRLGSWAEGRY